MTNWMYLTAGLLAGGGVVFHGVYGYVQVPAKLDADDLPSSVFGDGAQTLWMLRLCWHSFTAVLVVAAVTLIHLGLDDTGSAGAPATIGAVMAVIVVAWVVAGGSRRRLLHPGLPIVIVATVLTLAGMQAGPA